MKIYMSLKPGNLYDLLGESPSVRADQDVLMRLLRDMLEALDYLADVLGREEEEVSPRPGIDRWRRRG